MLLVYVDFFVFFWRTGFTWGGAFTKGLIYGNHRLKLDILGDMRKL